MFSASAAGPSRTLSEQEILALAISSEEDDGRIYRAYADGLRDDFPASANVFDGMADEEDRHRAALIDLHRKRFGERIPLIRREHVKGYYERKPDWLVRPLGIDKVRGAGRGDGGPGAPLLPRGREAHGRRLDPKAARRSCRSGEDRINRWRTGWD